jgi:hypothetical protein
MSGPPADYEFWLKPEKLELRENIAISRGDGLRTDLDDPMGGATTLMRRAWEEYISAMRALVHDDLTTEDGLAFARRHQAEAQRYLDLVRWITETLETRDEIEWNREHGQTTVFEDGNKEGNEQ